MIKIAVIEDETASQQDIAKCIERFSKENNIPLAVQLYSCGEDFFTSKEVYDIAMIDIHFPSPNMDGLSIAKRIRQKNTLMAIIFVTSDAKYAIQAYEVQARYYILKPVHYLDLAHKLTRTLESLNLATPKKFYVKTADGAYVFESREIRYVEIVNHTLYYHLTDKIIKRTGTLTDLEKALPEQGFCKCNRCFVVNFHYITKISGNDLYIGKDVLTISQSMKKEFNEKFKLWLTKGGR